MKLEVPPGHRYVGEWIELRLTVEADSTPPSITWPHLASAEIFAPKDPDVRSISADVREYRYVGHILPRQAGRLIVPAVSVKIEAQSKSTVPKTLDIRPIPPVGRTATFLGGVGKIEASAEAGPASVPLGGYVDYRLVLRGNGAAGSIVAPDLSRWEQAGLAYQTVDSVFSSHPPTRTLRLRLRTMKTGPIRIPSILISWFDPDSGRFQTTATKAVSLHVQPLENLSPSAVKVVETEEPPRGGWRALASLMAVLGAIVGLGLFGWLWVGRWKRRAPQRLAAKLLRDFATCDEMETLGLRITSGLATFLSRFAGRPPGVITPEEVRDWVEKMTRDRLLADRARLLIEACDRAAFGSGSVGRDELRSRAEDVLGGLVGAGKPREAPGATPV